MSRLFKSRSDVPVSRDKNARRMKTWEDAVEHVKLEDFERLAKSDRELGAQFIALTAVVDSMAIASIVDYERLEESVNFAAKQLRPGHRSALLTKPAMMLQDLEVMQKVLRVETRKRHNRRKRNPAAG